jgi:hypothetical protein
MTGSFIAFAARIILVVVILWFSSAFLYQAAKWRNAGMLINGLGILIIGVPFLLDLVLREWKLYNIFVWAGVLICCWQWVNYVQFMKERQISPVDILLYR